LRQILSGLLLDIANICLCASKFSWLWEIIHRLWIFLHLNYWRVFIIYLLKILSRYLCTRRNRNFILLCWLLLDFIFSCCWYDISLCNELWNCL